MAESLCRVKRYTDVKNSIGLEPATAVPQQAQEMDTPRRATVNLLLQFLFFYTPSDNGILIESATMTYNLMRDQRI